MLHVVIDKLVSKSIELGKVKNRLTLPEDEKTTEELYKREEMLHAQVDNLKECLVEYVWTFTQ